MKRQKPFIIGVAGGSGSGKTTVSNRIREMVGDEIVGDEIVGDDQLAYLQHDSYYHDASHLPLDERALQNYDHPKSLDTPLLIDHLIQLRSGNPVQMPIYDFATYTRSRESFTLYPARVILVEGILIFSDKSLREQMDMCIFVDTDADLCFIRRLQRDVNERGRTQESVIEQYLATVRPMHLEFVEPSKRYADIIVPNGGRNAVALDLIVSRIHELLHQAN